MEPQPPNDSSWGIFAAGDALACSMRVFYPHSFEL